VPEALQKSLWVALGGVLGANARYWLGVWSLARWGSGFPWGTLVINVTGSLLLGLVYGLFTAKFGGKHAEALRLALGTGFLGAYTTFSTFSYETLVLAENGQWQKAIGYVVGSVVLGLIGAWVGMRLASLF
jgi:fluoride exporter